MDHKFKSKWDSNSFLFDQKDCGYQGLSWPQRNFMCNFCNKEYKSAQALGGHMNIHRRDKARLRLSSPPSVDHHLSNSNPNPNYVSPPSPVRYLPYKTFHSSPFPLVSTTSVKDELPLFGLSGRDFLGGLRGSMTKEGDGHGENGIRVWKKNEVFNMEMEMGLLEDGKIELDLDLELRLGRS